MSVITMKNLLEAGVHFGHQTRRWNPKMAPYIFTERNGIYIIDLQKTVKKVEEAYVFVKEIVEEGGTVLFVGTKKQGQEAIESEAKCRMSTKDGWAVCLQTTRQSRPELTDFSNSKKWKKTERLKCFLKLKLSNLNTKENVLKSS